MIGRITTALCAAALAASLMANAQQTVYRWVDKDGKVHFSDAPPPPEAKDSSSKRMGGGEDASPQLPFATQEAMKRNPVTLFVSNDCGELCTSGRALLARRGVPYSERNATESREAAEAVKKAVGALQVPVLLIGDKTVKGFDEELWNASLDDAGYAREALPGQRLPAQPSAAR